MTEGTAASLVEALKPFADAACNVPQVADDAEWIDPDEGQSFQYGQLRRAAAALAALHADKPSDGVWVPRERLREWYTAAWAAEVALSPQDDDVEASTLR